MPACALPACRHIWASTADGSFTVEEDKENEPLGRGTLLKIHLKAEAKVRRGAGRWPHLGPALMQHAAGVRLPAHRARLITLLHAPLPHIWSWCARGACASRARGVVTG